MAQSPGTGGESPKRFFKKVLQRGPYYELATLLQKNPNLSVSARVRDDNGHYVHWNSTSVEMEAEGYLGDGENEMSIPDAVYALVDKARSETDEWSQTWNKKIEKELYAELEYNQSDEALIEWMNANQWTFDEDGNQVDMTDYLPVNGLQPGVRAKVIQQYSDLFDRTPDQVVQALLSRDMRFDKRGNRIDISGFKPIDQLPEEVRKPILEKHRNILVEGDDFWAQGIQDRWTDKLEALGFSGVKIRYSLGYSQGDGASFTADSIDVPKLCDGMLKQLHLQEQARALAVELIS